MDRQRRKDIMTTNTAAHLAPFTTEATSHQVAEQLLLFNMAAGNGLFVAETAHNTAVLVTRKAVQSVHSDVHVPESYAHQYDAVVSTKVVKFDGQFNGVGKLDLNYDFVDDYTVVGLFDNEAVIIEVSPFEGAMVVDRFRNYAHTNLYKDVELTDL